jgi:hypothetical protein
MRYSDHVLNDKFKRGGSSNSQRGSAVYQHPELVIKAITDKEGLDKAYARADKLFVNGDTLYVAGTSYWQDVWDVLKIPFNKTAEAQRYKDADGLLGKNPQIVNLVGHSLGGSSVLELQKNHAEKTFKTNTYGAPAASMTTPDNVNNHRYRNYGDPISMFDRGAESRLKPDALKNYAEAGAQFYTEGTVNQLSIYRGITSAHSYDNFDKNKISHEDYRHQPEF